MRFTKMHGLGNDYLYVFGEVPENIKDLSVRLSDRHFGAGSDGMIYIAPSETADFRMRIFNADGSEANMCGNGIRCVGKYVYDKGYTDKLNLAVETLSGIKYLKLQVSGGKVRTVAVEMGEAKVQEEIRLELPGMSEADLKAAGFSGTGFPDGVPVSVGNPHVVFFVNDAEQFPLDTIGPLVEHHSLFPGGVNAEFVQVLSGTELRMRVWERGSHITMACGTGACASVAAAVWKGFCRENVPVTVHLDGGDLTVTMDRKHRIIMEGPAEFVYEGETIDG